MDRIVLKIGGSELDREGFVDGLIEALRELWGRYAVALVHGGGKAIARLQEQLCLEPRFVEGLRVTDDESLDVAEMVLSGLVNKRLVGQMVAAGVPALGLSGVDNGLLRVAKMDRVGSGAQHDLGWVGDIRETHAAPLEGCRRGWADGSNMNPVGQTRTASTGPQLVPESRHTVGAREDNPVVRVQTTDRLPERRRIAGIRYPDGRTMRGLRAQPAQTLQQPLGLRSRPRHLNAAPLQRSGLLIRLSSRQNRSSCSLAARSLGPRTVPGVALTGVGAQYVSAGMAQQPTIAANPGLTGR